MKRRGPDSEGIWTDGEWCALGFRRLSVLDLSPSGHQPMISSDGRYVLVFNGEIYNFRELRVLLEHDGVVFRSSGDTEVLLYALARWGKEALSKLNGMFAFAFYDTVECRLLLARDHAGIKPLYYLHSKFGLVFGSQYDQLLSHPFGRTLRVSPSALSMYIQFGYIPAPYALLENTFMLNPGSWLEITSSYMRQGKYYEFPMYREPDLFGIEAYEMLESVINNAIKRQLVSDVPIGAFLSGGIDSPLVSAMIAATGLKNLKAFTIRTDNLEFDESQDAINYARELDLLHYIETITPENTLEMLDQVVAASGEPLADYSIIPTLLVSRLARKHVTVCFSGDGGDELFWGYAFRSSHVLRNSEEFRQAFPLRQFRYGIRKTFGFGTISRDLRYRTIGDRYYHAHARMDQQQLNQLFPELYGAPDDFMLFSYNGHDINRTAQWLRWNEFNGQLTRVLLKVDRASMYNSLEVRVPLLDKEVVDIATRIDWRSCIDIHTETGKQPLRYILAKHVKSQSQKKRGFTIPIGEWLRHELREEFTETVLKRDSFLGFSIDHSILRRLYNSHLSGQHDYSPSLWILFTLARWEDNYYRMSR